MLSCSRSIASALVSISSPSPSCSSGQGIPPAPASSSPKWISAITGVPACFRGVRRTLKNGSCQFSVLTLLCLAKALIRREGTRTCCRRADNIALIYTPFASIKFSIAAVNPVVFNPRFCVVLKVLTTLTNRQQILFSYDAAFLNFPTCVDWTELFG